MNRVTASFIVAVACQFLGFVTHASGAEIPVMPTTTSEWLPVIGSIATIGAIYESFRRVRIDVAEIKDDVRDIHEGWSVLRERIVRIETKIGMLPEKLGQ